MLRMQTPSGWKCLLACLLSIAWPLVCSAIDANTSSAVTIDGQTCASLEFESLPPSFRYDARVESWVLATCGRGTITFSRFYINDACRTSRNNQYFITGTGDVGCQTVSDSTVATCNRVFVNNADNVISSSTLNNPPFSLDAGLVCAEEDSGYMFVQNNCTLPITVTMRLQTSNYDGTPCVAVAGSRFSIPLWAIIVIAVGGFIVLAGLFLCICCCCCQAACCCF